MCAYPCLCAYVRESVCVRTHECVCVRVRACVCVHVSVFVWVSPRFLYNVVSYFICKSQ